MSEAITKVRSKNTSYYINSVIGVCIMLFFGYLPTFSTVTPMYLELTLPSGEIWTKGDPQAENYIKGSAKEWAMVSVRRRNWMDTSLEVVGDEARRYASVVQCYAGAADSAPEAKHQR